jgi:hypothetical protein
MQNDYSVINSGQAFLYLDAKANVADGQLGAGPGHHVGHLVVTVGRQISFPGWMQPTTLWFPSRCYHGALE